MKLILKVEGFYISTRVKIDCNGYLACLMANHVSLHFSFQTVNIMSSSIPKMHRITFRFLAALTSIINDYSTILISYSALSEQWVPCLVFSYCPEAFISPLT